MPQFRKPTACVVGAGFAGPAHVEALRRNGVEVLALAADGMAEAGRESGGIEHSARVRLPPRGS